MKKLILHSEKPPLSSKEIHTKSRRDSIMSNCETPINAMEPVDEFLTKVGDSRPEKRSQSSLVYRVPVLHFWESCCFLANHPWIHEISMTAHSSSDKVISPARDPNPRTVQTRGLDNSTRRNFFTQLLPLLLEDPRSCAMDRKV